MNNTILLNKFRIHEAATNEGLKMKEVAELIGTSYQTMQYRFTHGWRAAEARELARLLKVELKVLEDFI